MTKTTVMGSGRSRGAARLLWASALTLALAGTAVAQTAAPAGTGQSAAPAPQPAPSSQPAPALSRRASQPGNAAWHEFKTSKLAEAVYGAPGRGNELLRMACHLHAGQSIVLLPRLTVGAHPSPTTTTVVFSVDGTAYNRAARLLTNKRTGAGRPIVTVNRLDPLVGALTSGHSLSIELKPSVPGQSPVTVPLGGASQAIGAMLGAC